MVLFAAVVVVVDLVSLLFFFLFQFFLWPVFNVARPLSGVVWFKSLKLDSEVMHVHVSLRLSSLNLTGCPLHQTIRWSFPSHHGIYCSMARCFI